jgi:hypothetical protein
MFHRKNNIQSNLLEIFLHETLLHARINTAGCQAPKENHNGDGDFS